MNPRDSGSVPICIPSYMGDTILKFSKRALISHCAFVDRHECAARVVSAWLLRAELTTTRVIWICLQHVMSWPSSCFFGEVGMITICNKTWTWHDFGGCGVRVWRSTCRMCSFVKKYVMSFKHGRVPADAPYEQDTIITNQPGML